MPYIEQYTDEELQAEIERRKQAAKVSNKPKVLDNFLVIDIVEACQAYIDFRYSNEWNDDRADDYENAIFETAMQTLYGKDVFDKLTAIRK